MKVRPDTYKIICQLKDETRLSGSELIKILVDYAYKNIEWVED